MDDHLEHERTEKDIRLEREKRLTEGGAQIKNMALNRASRAAGVFPDSTNGRDGTPVTTPKAPKLRRRIIYESEDETEDALLKDLELRRLQEDRRFELEEQRYDMEKRKMEEEGKRFTAGQETKRRKIELDEKKAEVEMEERRVAMRERLKMIEVLAGLANKLQ